MKKVVKFFKEVRSELKKVRWPSKDQVMKLTVVVLLITSVSAIYLGSLDILFTKLVEGLLR